MKVLQEHIAELVCQEDQMLLDLAWLIHERGLPSRRINPKTGRILRTRMGFPKPVLRAKQALSNLRSWRVPFDFVVDAETIWRYSEKYGGLSAGVNRLGRSREIICAS